MEKQGMAIENEQEKTLSKSEDSSNRNDGSTATSSPSSSSTNTPVVNGQHKKVKSCKGGLYYSSHLRSVSRKPLCVGLTRSLPNVPRTIVLPPESEESKVGRSFTDFKYACVGYSIYMDKKEHTSNGQETHIEVPVCLGLKVLMSADPVSAPHIHNAEDSKGIPHRPSPKPTNSGGEPFLSRFGRNANLVANGVVKNVSRVGNQIKQSIDDVLYPYRRRPK